MVIKIERSQVEQMEKAAALVGVNVSFTFIEDIAYAEVPIASSTLTFYLGRAFETFVREKNFEDTYMFPL